jgi:hypothetical protein
MNQLADAVAASPDPNNNNSSSARSSNGGRRRRRWGVGRRGESLCELTRHDAGRRIIALPSRTLPNIR